MIDFGLSGAELASAMINRTFATPMQSITLNAEGARMTEIALYCFDYTFLVHKVNRNLFLIHVHRLH